MDETKVSDPEQALRETYEIAYSESVKSLESQVDQIGQARSRATTLLTGATVATAFLAGIASDQMVKSPTSFKWGLAIYSVLTLFCVLVLAPIWKFAFEVQARNVIGWAEDPDNPDSPGVILRTLAWHKQGHWAENRKRLNRMYMLLFIAFVLLPAELACWVWPLIRNL